MSEVLARSGFPAQADNLPTTEAIQLLNEAANMLVIITEILAQRAPTRRNRTLMRQHLAGVVAKVEIVRLALDR